MVFGGHLEQARGSAQQSGCRGGIDSPLTRSPPASHQSRPCPGSSHRGTKSCHGPANSAWVIAAGTGPGPGHAGARTPARPLCAERAAGSGSEAGARHRDRHAPQLGAPRKHCCWGPGHRSGWSHRLVPPGVCAARLPLGNGKAGRRGAAKGCGATSRGNLAGSAPPQVA